MALPAADSFNGSEDPLTTDWGPGPATQQCLESGTGARRQPPSEDSASIWDVDAFNADQWAQATLLVGYTGVCLRSDANDGYAIWYRDADRTRITRRDDKVSTDVHTQTGQSNANNDVIYAKVEGAGGTFTVTVGDSAEFTHDDNTYTAGSAGIIILSSASSAVDALGTFSAGDLGGGETPIYFDDDRGVLRGEKRGISRGIMKGLAL